VTRCGDTEEGLARQGDGDVGNWGDACGEAPRAAQGQKAGDGRTLGAMRTGTQQRRHREGRGGRVLGADGRRGAQGGRKREVCADTETVEGKEDRAEGDEEIGSCRKDPGKDGETGGAVRTPATERSLRTETLRRAMTHLERSSGRDEGLTRAKRGRPRAKDTEKELQKRTV